MLCVPLLLRHVPPITPCTSTRAAAVEKLGGRQQTACSVFITTGLPAGRLVSVYCFSWPRAEPSVLITLSVWDNTHSDLSFRGFTVDQSVFYKTCLLFNPRDRGTRSHRASSAALTSLLRDPSFFYFTQGSPWALPELFCKCHRCIFKLEAAFSISSKDLVSLESDWMFAQLLKNALLFFPDLILLLTGPCVKVKSVYYLQVQSFLWACHGLSDSLL